MDIFFQDQIEPYIGTIEMLEKTSKQTNSIVNVPVLFGDDFAYTDAQYTFDYLLFLANLLKDHSYSRYGI